MTVAVAGSESVGPMVVVACESTDVDCVAGTNCSVAAATSHSSKVG